LSEPLTIVVSDGEVDFLETEIAPASIVMLETIKETTALEPLITSVSEGVVDFLVEEIEPAATVTSSKDVTVSVMTISAPKPVLLSTIVISSALFKLKIVLVPVFSLAITSPFTLTEMLSPFSSNNPLLFKVKVAKRPSITALPEIAWPFFSK